MLNLSAVTLCTLQAKAMADFYQGVLGRAPDMVEAKEGFYAWQAGKTYFMILEHSEMKGKTKDPGRTMVNFETPQVREEFERIKALGATVVRAPYQIDKNWIATLADPDGNYFQLVSPM